MTYDEFYRNGVQIIPSVFTVHEVEELRAAAHAAVQGSNPRYPHTFVEHAPSGSPAIMFFPALCNRVMDRFRTDERLLKIVRDVLGDNVKQLNNQFYFRYAGDGDSWTRTITPQKFGRMLATQPLTRFAKIAPKRTNQSRGWSRIKIKEPYEMNIHTKIIEAKSSF